MLTVLPIVDRELRVTARRAGTYWSRVVVAGGLLLLSAWLLLITGHSSAPSQAKTLFITLTGAALVVCGASGAFTAADSLSGEKREGTLGLLFLTPLRGLDVVLGKLCASSLTVCYGLLAITPIVALPILLGGISAGEYLRVALLLLNTMWLSLTCAIWVSSVSRNEKAARAIALLIMLLLAGGFPLMGAVLEFEMKARESAQYFMIFSPGYAFGVAWDATRTTPWLGYWPSLGTQLLLGWVFLLLACWFTPRSWRDRPVRALSFTGFPRRDAGTTFSAGPEPDFRRRTLGINPFFWLTCRPVWRHWLVWGALILLVGLWLALGSKYEGLFDPAMFVFLAILWNGMLKLWVASEATRQLAVDRKSGSIELLLSTPLTDADIARGQWLSLCRQFAGPAAATGAAELLLMLIGLSELGRGDDGAFWVAVWLCGLAVLYADLMALYAVGLWQSVAARGPAEAAGATAFRILALPWILFGVLGAGLALAEQFRVLPDFDHPEYMLLGLWTLLSLGVNAWFGLGSWHRFTREFRQRAADRWRRRGVWLWSRAPGRASTREAAP